MEYFIKDGARYRSIGFDIPNYLNEGLWLIQRKPGFVSTEAMIHRLAQLPEKIEVENYLKLFLNKDQLVEALIELQVVKNGESYEKTAELILNQIINNNLKQFQCPTKKF